MALIRRLTRIFRDFTARNQANAVEAYSAQASLFVIISFFPTAILLLSLLPHLPFTQSQIAGALSEIIPDAIADFARSILSDLYETSSIPLLSLTAVMAMWSSSKGAVSLLRGLDRIYGVHRTRGYIFLRLLASLYLILMFLILVLVLAFLGFGSIVVSWLAEMIPVLKTSVWLKSSMTLLLSFAVLFLLFWFLYTLVPQRRTTLFREVPGALIAAAGWVGFSSLYSLYLDNIGGISLYYGSLSLVMFSLLWLYFCMYIFFVGAEVNVWIQENLTFSKREKKKKSKR